MFSRQRLIIVDEISSKPGLFFEPLNYYLLDLILHFEEGIKTNFVLAGLKKSLKSLDELEIEDANFGPIPVKNVLKPCTILL